MTSQQELAKQNKKLDQLEMALESLHNTSKAVGDSLEEQITCGLERSVIVDSSNSSRRIRIGRTKQPARCGGTCGVTSSMMASFAGDAFTAFICRE